MSDPIDKLKQTCSILGDECKELVKKREKNELDDVGFVNKYFDMLERMPNNSVKKKVVEDLEEYIKKDVQIHDESEKKEPMFFDSGVPL